MKLQGLFVKGPKVDSQAFAASAGDKHGFQFAALYTLQHGLTRDAQFHGCLQHRQILRWSLGRDARSQLFGDTDLPWSARSNLFTGDEAFGKPTMDSGSVHAQDLCGLVDGDNFALRSIGGWLKTRNAAIAAQTADLISGEAFPARRLSSLTIQDAGDHLVGIERRQAGQQ